ncbi:MAG: hypothetical protein EB084_14845 [Proteobacteria bacterium]|nr:hypothetical protein [Pseudomonadota bacterium]
MDDLRQHIRSEEGGLERLMRKIPGFAGYKDREQRRQADQIQRTFMADALTRERDRLSDVGSILMSHGGLAQLPAIDRVRNVFDKVIDRIRHATHGYSGFYDAIRINEAELDRVYEFDLSMLSDIAAAGEAITALGAAAEQQSADFAERLRGIEGGIKGLDQKLDNRTRVMMGVN